MPSQKKWPSLAVFGFAIAPAIIILLDLWSCNGNTKAKTAAKPGPDDVVLKFAEFSVKDKELNRFIAYCQRMDPSLALAKIRRDTFTGQILPHFVAHSLLDPETVRAQERKAEDLAKAVANRGGDISDLRKLGAPFGGEQPDRYFLPFNHLSLDVAEIAFTLEPGRASAAIHSAQGSLVLAVVEEKDVIAGSSPARKLYTVFFPYSEAPDFGKLVREKIKSVLQSTPRIHSLYLDDFAPLFRKTINPLPDKDQHP